MKIAYFEVRAEPPTADESAITVLDNTAALQALPDDAGVAWWVGSRHQPTAAEALGRLQFLNTYGPSPFAFTPHTPQASLAIDRVWLDDADVQLLISQLNSDLFSRYPEPGALIFSLHPADIVDGVGALLMAVHDGMPVGCIAFRVVDEQPGSAEIKRMYVSLAGRGKKIGAALLVEVERQARQLGVHRFILEAGPRQPEALLRFRQAGYVECEPWGEFVDKELSICMEKLISSPD